MSTRLRALPWGSMAVAVAYVMAVLPIAGITRMSWLAVGVMLAYLVLAIRTTRTTAEIAHSSNNQSAFALWCIAFRTTLLNRALLILPMFSLMLASQQFLAMANYSCSTLLRAFCSLNNGLTQLEPLMIASLCLGVFLLLDHGLLVALTLLADKHLVKSPAFVGNTAVGLRMALACTILGVGATGLNIWETAYSSEYYSPYAISANIPRIERHVSESLTSAFEPLVTTGILLNANVLSHSSYCAVRGESCANAYDTRPFVARQMVSALLGMLMYGLLIVGTLRLVSPFSLRLSVTEKAKRGFLNDAEPNITYL